MRRWLAVAALLWCAAAGAGEGKAPVWGVALDGNPIAAAQIAQAERESGRRAVLVLFYIQWPEHPAADGFPRESLETIRRAGAVPVLSWEPMFYRDGKVTEIPAAAILGGEYDAYIDRFAIGAREWGGELILRFGHEANLDWYHWGTAAAAFGPESPAIYKALFRYVVKRFRQAGTTGVKWAFCPNADSVPAAPWNRAAAYYPGDDVVDLLGMDGYNWGTTRTAARDGWTSNWRSFEETFGALRQELLALAPGKPLYVFETASASEGGDRREWFREALATARRWGLAGLVWFQVNKELDWRWREE